MNEPPERSCPLKAFSVPALRASSALAGAGIQPGIEHGDLRCSGEQCAWWMASNRHGKPGRCAVVVLAQAQRTAK